MVNGQIAWRRKWQPTPVFLSGEFHGQRSLVGYSPWGHKESDTTEWLTHDEQTESKGEAVSRGQWLTCGEKLRRISLPSCLEDYGCKSQVQGESRNPSISHLPLTLYEYRDETEHCGIDPFDRVVLKLWLLNQGRVMWRNFPGGPLVKSPCSQSGGPGLNPWSGN